MPLVGRIDGRISRIHTIKDVAFVVTRFPDFGWPLVACNARANAAVDPLFVVVVAVGAVDAVEAGTAAPVYATAATAPTPETALAARHAAAHWRVDAVVASTTPGVGEAEGLELGLVLWCDGTAVF